MTIWQRVHRADQSDPESWHYRALAWSGTLAMGIWATFLFFCLAVDLLHIFVLWVQLLRPGLFPFDAQTLRHFPVILIFLSAIFAVFGLQQAVQGPEGGPRPGSH